MADPSFVHQLSPIDHLSPRIHIPKLLYFATDSEPHNIYSVLLNALSESLDAFPILAGSVGLLKSAVQTGTLAVQAPFFTASDILSAKDLRNEYDYEFIRAKHFPADAVDEKSVVGDVAGNPSRVLLAQVNYIRGGVILTCALHHCVVDETGVFSLMKLWSTYCQGANGASFVKSEWIDRTVLSMGRGPGKLADHPEYTLQPAKELATNSTSNAQYISQSSNTTGSAVFFFSDESLKRLKRDASVNSDEKLGSPEVSTRISTNDALCALIWGAVTRARSLGPDVKYSMFNMTINGRRRMKPPMSPEYTGNVVFVSKAALGLDSLVDTANFSKIAQTIRQSILEIDDDAIRDKIKAVMSVDDIGRLAPGGYSSHKRNLGCTSWSEQEYYALDWGKVMGGTCKRLRWRSNISDGIFVIFPRLPDTEDFEGGGGVEVYLGLEDDCLERLFADTTFNSYAKRR